MGTSRHKARAPIGSKSTHPSKLVTPVHRVTSFSSPVNQEVIEMSIFPPMGLNLIQIDTLAKSYSALPHEGTIYCRAVYIKY